MAAPRLKLALCANLIIEKVIIVGSGCTVLTAAIYAARVAQNCAVLNQKFQAVEVTMND
jgi:thioredoxin reductase